VRQSDLLRELTADNKATLPGGAEGRAAYLAYFQQVEEVLRQLLHALQTRYRGMERSGDASAHPLESKVLETYVRRFLNSLDCLHLKYLCEPDRRLRYDPSDSSFPNHIELREMEQDQTRADSIRRELPSADALKQAILDFIFQHKAVPDALMRQLGQREYYNALITHSQLWGLFFGYTPGELELLDDTGGRLTREYAYHWGAYDVLTNRPHIYLLIFEQNAKKPLLQDDAASREAFLAAVQKHCINTAPLGVMARDLDEFDDDLHPKLLKRMAIGPLHSRYATDDSIYTKILNTHFGTDDLVLEFQTESIFSIGQERKRKGLMGGKTRERFFIDNANPLHREHGISASERFLLASHGVIQYLHDQHKPLLDALAHPPFRFTPPAPAKPQAPLRSRPGVQRPSPAGGPDASPSSPHAHGTR
jgi:hypothetical protein